MKSNFSTKSISIVQYTTSIRFPNAQTDNSTPTFSGYTETGSTVKLFDNDILLGSTNSTADGSWYITPSNPLSVGSHTIVAKSFDGTGQQLSLDTKSITILPVASGIMNLINGMGGADNLIGSSNSDYFEMDGYLNMYKPDEGLIGSPEGTVASGNDGNDIFHYYTNHNYFGNSSTWSAPHSTINGGSGTDSLFIHGESIGAVKIWDITNITMNSIEKLVLAWDPPNSNLTINMTDAQYNMLSKFIVLPANDTVNLKITVNGNIKSDAINKIITSDGADYVIPASARRLIGTSASNETIDATK